MNSSKKLILYLCLGVLLAASFTGCSKSKNKNSSASSAAYKDDGYSYNAVVIEFDACGGSVDVDNKAVLKGQAYGELPVAELFGCDFDGWYTDRYEGVNIVSSTIMPTDGQDMTLYARYKTKPGQWEIRDLRYYYTDWEGKTPISEWRYIDNYWYYFDNVGRAVMGWQKIDGTTYYMEVDGKMATGWKRYNGQWYYLRDYPDGDMAVGWQTIGDDWYFFDSEGARFIGWGKINDEWYYFDNKGRMLTGWQDIGGDTYYFDEEGKMFTGVCKLEGKVYCFTDKGTLIRDENTTYGYVNKDGVFEGNK